MNNSKEIQAMQLPIQKLRPFENHPFQVKDDDEMNQLVWSVLTQGVLTPLVVRPLENNEYEVISGHRRLHACQKAGIETVPALIYALDRDAAAIALEEATIHGQQYISVEELQQASGVANSVFDKLRSVGALGSLPETSQVDLFSLM